MPPLAVSQQQPVCEDVDAADITAIGGLFVAALAYRGYRRYGSTKMRALAVGIGLLTTGVFLAAITTAVIGAGTGVV
ncbi:hypothetical protein DVK04_19680, partial [Haloferax sp. Atlit-105R]